MVEATELEHLRELIRKDRVYYQVRPEYEVVEGSRKHAGYEVQLWGALNGEGDHVPGSTASGAVYRDLAEIARHLEDAISQTPVCIEREPFTGALYDSPRAKTDEVRLSIHVSPFSDDAHAAQAEDETLHALRHELRHVGIGEGHFREPEQVAQD